MKPAESQFTLKAYKNVIIMILKTANTLDGGDSLYAQENLYYLYKKRSFSARQYGCNTHVLGNIQLSGFNNKYANLLANIL